MSSPPPKLNSSSLCFHSSFFRWSIFSFFHLSPSLLPQTSIGLCASLQATFYPLEASKKGASPAQFGAVFGIIHLSLFVFGPLVGKYLPVWGVRVIFFAGFLIDGGSFLLFGLLQWVDHKMTFLVTPPLTSFQSHSNLQVLTTSQKPNQYSGAFLPDPDGGRHWGSCHMDLKPRYSYGQVRRTQP